MASELNQAGYDRQSYKGAKSTLCSGCGHDSITNHLISALYQSSIHPHQVAKLSGIGCSSKTPTYFLDKAAGFNSLHGRMAPIATGAKMANHHLKVLGISGDGDSASIGLGSFCHLLRRRVPMLYMVENNGIYGLTKGQFSATADQGSTRKTGVFNDFVSIDLCALAIEMGCGFVARSFSGDAKQLVPLLRAALKFEGTAFIDVISPCVAFANHPGSTKSYQAVKERRLQLQSIGFIEAQEEIHVDYAHSTWVEMHDGSKLALSKLDPEDHDFTDAPGAIKRLHQAREEQKFITGLLYFNKDQKNLVEQQGLGEKPLSELEREELIPSPEQFKAALDEFAY